MLCFSCTKKKKGKKNPCLFRNDSLYKEISKGTGRQRMGRKKIEECKVHLTVVTVKWFCHDEQWIFKGWVNLTQRNNLQVVNTFLRYFGIKLITMASVSVSVLFSIANSLTCPYSFSPPPQKKAPTNKNDNNNQP